ncbi:MAG: hypothetical protein MJZ20_13890, partial [Bacteroidaceae bacterium]|nr:hypothetical protein [Bacteroidaceae bacterium]
MKKRLLILSVLLLMVCGQMWAGRSGSAGASGTYNGISYTLYSNYSYYCWWSDQSQNLGDVAVITECKNSTMVIPESLGGCNQIVIGEEALKSAVTSLTISKSVKLLEYCAVYYANQIQTLTIEDSETPLYCGGTKYTYSYGAFSFIKNLKSVYIGRNLEYEHTESDHSYAPFRYCDSGMHYNNESFDVTIGPNVTKIADYCFEYCGVKSLTVKRSLSQASQNNPIDWGKKAFENFDEFVTSNVPCYVSWTALDNFKNKSDYKTMFNYQLGVEPCRYEALEKIKQKREDTNYSDIKSELEAACADYETTIKNTNDINLMQLLMTRIFAVMELLKQKYDYPSDVAASIVSEYKAKIDNANIDNIEGERDNGKQALVDAKALQDAKTAAKNDLTEAKTTYPSDAADEIVSTYTGKINAATSTTDVTNEKEAGIKALKDAKDLQDAKAAAIAALNEAAKTYPSDAANGIVTTYTAKINTATSTTNVTKEKEAGIKALMDAKDLQDAKEAAIAALNEAAKTYPSDVADEIVSSYIGKINAATSTTDVTNEKEAGIKALKDAKDLQEEKADAITALNNEAGKDPSDAVKNILNGYTTKINAATSITDVETQKNNGIAAIQLQKKKETAIAALNAAKETYPSYVADEIVSTYTGKINAATTTDAVTKEKEAGIKALMDAYNVQKEAERLAALDAVTVQQLADDDFSYLLEG